VPSGGTGEADVVGGDVGDGVQAEAPLDEVLPAGQLLHVAVAAVENVPAAQSVQMEAPDGA